MKILITTDWYAPAINGVVTSVLNLQRELTAQGHEVKVLTLSRTPRSYRVGNVTYIGAVSAGKIYPGARFRTAPARHLLAALVQWRPDVIHSQCEFCTFLMARKIASATGAPLVHTYHTVYEDYTHYFSPSRKWGRQAIAAFSRMVLSRTAAVIVPTQKVEDLLLGYRVQQPIHVIPTGIDLSLFSAPVDPERSRQLKQKLKIPEGNFLLVYIGRLAEEKNVGTLLQCLASLNRGDVSLLLVGNGPYRAQLESQVRELGLTKNVIFAGMVSPQEVSDYYHLGDLFVSASTSETQGLTYIEALASGLPALCQQDPCLTAVIEDGVNGWQFRDPVEFRSYLNRFLEDAALREEMSRQAVKLADENFSAAAFAARALEVYRQVVAAQQQSEVA